MVFKVTPEQAAASAQAVAAANAKAGLTGKATDGAGKLNADFNFFLKMLTTQLTHQDPTQPMDTTAMTQQIATFSGVEQQVQTNARLDKLMASNATMTQQSQLATAGNYIGREIETKGSTGQVYGGQGAFSYILPEKADKVQITIKNAEGETVFEGQGSTTKGRNVLLWDGVNSVSKEQEPDGVYTISVVAKDAKQKAITVEKRAVWAVAGYEKDKDGNILLNVGFDNTVKFDDVLTVRSLTRANLEPEPDGEDTTAGGDDTTDETEES